MGLTDGRYGERQNQSRIFRIFVPDPNLMAETWPRVQSARSGKRVDAVLIVGYERTANGRGDNKADVAGYG
jgi:hypothetical protein